MSRLFEALKGASQFRESADGGVADNVWKALGVEEQAKSAATPTAAQRVGAATIEAPVEDAVAELAPSIEKTSIGTPQKVVLDKRARLLPHITDSRIVERYRMLRTKIMQERSKEQFKTLVVTSPNPQEGKTVTALNLALSFATLPDFKVLVVDGDMRRGTLGSWLGVDDNRSGLSNLIDGSAQLEDVVLRSTDLPMDFILRGNSLVQDIEAAHYARPFRQMAAMYDLVIVDSPPVNVITDVQLMAGSCDAILLVARAFATTRKALEHAARSLEPFRVVGTVLNAGEPQNSHRYNGYYY
jgi:protein-tyrosine kinase